MMMITMKEGTIMTMNQYTQNKNENKDDYNHNDYNKHTGPGVSEEMMIRIGKAYMQNVARQITAAAARVIEDGLREFDPDTVLLAIEETGLAPKPSPAYLRAILRNWKEKGVSARVQKPWWQNPALQCEQREGAYENYVFPNIEDLAK